MAKNELFANYQFLLEIDGIATAYFKSVSGLDSEVEVIEHRETNKGREVVRKVPGLRKWGDITFKRGMTTTPRKGSSSSGTTTPSSPMSATSTR